MKERIVGYQMTFSIHSSQIARNPSLGPNATFTHVYMPLSGQPDASSAETSATGIKKNRAERARKIMIERPYSAKRGKFLILHMAQTLIRAIVEAVRVFFWNIFFLIADAS